MAIAARPFPVAAELRIVVQPPEQIVHRGHDGTVSTKSLQSQCSKVSGMVWLLCQTGPGKEVIRNRCLLLHRHGEGLTLVNHMEDQKLEGGGPAAVRRALTSVDSHDIRVIRMGLALAFSNRGPEYCEDDGSWMKSSRVMCREV